MDIGDRIKEVRNNNGLTQEELAKKCGISKNAIWNYENNHRQPNIAILSDIATALDISLSDLIEAKETLTNKLIELIDKTVYKNFDAVNTLELICELIDIDIDIDILNKAIHDKEDISESYLVAMINLVYKEEPIEFCKFYNENKEFILKGYLICYNRCEELESDFIKNKLPDYGVSLAELLYPTDTKKANEFKDVIKKESYNRPAIETFSFLLEQMEDENLKKFFIDIIINNKLDDKTIHYLITKLSKYLEYELYKLNKEK